MQISQTYYQGLFHFFLDSSLKRKAGGVEAPENSAANNVDNQARKRFSDIEQSTLDTIYMTCAGKPDKATIESAANALKIPEKQVSDCMFFWFIGYGSFVILNLLTFLGGGGTFHIYFGRSYKLLQGRLYQTGTCCCLLKQATRQLRMFAAQ